MKAVAAIENWVSDSPIKDSRYKSWLLRKKFIRTVFIPRLIENVSFLCGSIIAVVLIGPDETMGFVCVAPIKLPVGENVRGAINTFLSIITTIIVTSVVGFFLHKYYGFSNPNKGKASGVATLKKTFFETANWTCAAYFFSLINNLDFYKEAELYQFAVLVLYGCVGAFACISLSLLVANFHNLLEQNFKAGHRWINLVLFLVISTEIVTQATMLMAVLFLSNVLKFQAVHSESFLKTVTWMFVSFILITFML